MIGRHGYLCFVMIPDDRKKKEGWNMEEGDERASELRVDSVTPVSNSPVAAAEANQPKGGRNVAMAK